MKIKVNEKTDNPLLNRQDISFTVEHPGTSTPLRLDIRAKLVAMLNCKEDELFIIKLSGLYGQATAKGLAHLYPSKEAALQHEPAYIIKRHSKEDIASSETPPPPAPKEEKAKEPAKEEKAKEPAKEEKAKEPAKEEKAKEPAKEEKAKEPAKEEKAKEPAKEEKAKEPAKEEKAKEPAKEEKSESN
jgi:ribosomal protein S24E